MSANVGCQMKTLPALVVIAAILGTSGLAYAAQSKCEFSQNTIDEVTGERTIQTEFDTVTTAMSMGQTEANGAISILMTGGQRYLAIKFDATEQVRLPEQFAALPDPSWDPAYRDFLDELLGDTAIYPAGSTARLDLDDQTSLVLARDHHLRVRTQYAEPGQSVSSRSSTTKTAKKLVGFLAKMADADVDVNSDATRHYTVETKAVLKYPIDAEAEDILRRAAVTGIRIESRDRYYAMTWRSVQRQIVGWSDKSYLKIRDAMQCIDEAVGR